VCNIRCAFIGYKDIGDKGQTKDHFDIIDFTEDVDEVKKMIMKAKAGGGGGDHCEDVIGAL
jgi:hypothetical protein